MPAAASKTRDKIDVLIADDHRLFAETLEALLATDGRVEVVGQAHDGREAVDRAVKLNPDVVLMDIDMPIIDGLRATQLLRKSRSRACVLLVSGVEDERLEEARNVGAVGLIAKSSGPEAIERMLDTLAGGSTGAQTA